MLEAIELNVMVSTVVAIAANKCARVPEPNELSKACKGLQGGQRQLGRGGGGLLVPCIAEVV